MLLKKFLIRRYLNYCQIVSTVFDAFFCRNKYQIMIIQLLEGQFIRKQFRKKIIFIGYIIVFAILLF